MTNELLRAELERLHPDCWGWALACCRRNQDTAADALQTAYARILEGRARFRGHSSLRTWVFGVIRMVAREQRTQRLRQQRGESVVPESTGPVWATGIEDESAELIAALNALSPRQREVLELVFYHDLTIEQAAELMGVNLGTARTHYERGKQRLRQLLAPSREARG